jgi:hypothetical protein
MICLALFHKLCEIFVIDKSYTVVTSLVKVTLEVLGIWSIVFGL